MLPKYAHKTDGIWNSLVSGWNCWIEICDIEKGDIVKIVGLESETFRKYNGEKATFLKKQDKKYRIKLQDNREVLIKSENVLFVSKVNFIFKQTWFSGLSTLRPLPQKKGKKGKKRVKFEIL